MQKKTKPKILLVSAYRLWVGFASMTSFIRRLKGCQAPHLELPLALPLHIVPLTGKYWGWRIYLDFFCMEDLFLLSVLFSFFKKNLFIFSAIYLYQFDLRDIYCVLCNVSQHSFCKNGLSFHCWQLLFWFLCSSDLFLSMIFSVFVGDSSVLLYHKMQFDKPPIQDSFSLSERMKEVKSTDQSKTAYALNFQ